MKGDPNNKRLHSWMRRYIEYVFADVDYPGGPEEFDKFVAQSINDWMDGVDDVYYPLLWEQQAAQVRAQQEKEYQEQEEWRRGRIF